jgi:sugar phosphate isomerase/epimerase
MVHGWKLLKKLMDEVGDDLKVNFDPANIEMGLESSSEALNVLKDKIVHCHLKDADIIQSNEAVEKFMKKYDKLKDEFSFAEWLAAVDELRYYSEVQHGCGRVDFPYLFSELKKAGYQGPFIIEREAGTTRFEDALAAAELAEKYLN